MSFLQAVGHRLQLQSDVAWATPGGQAGTDAQGAQAMEVDMSLTGSAEVSERGLQSRPSLSCLCVCHIICL